MIATAAAAADERGFASLTMALVAERLGVRTPSLYKHVDGLAELQQGIAALAATELGDALRDAMQGVAGREALTAAARVIRSYASNHPGRYAATTGAALDAEFEASSTRVLESLSAALRGYRIDPAEQTHALRTLRSALHGFATIEQSNGFQLAADVDESFAWMIDFLDRGLRRD
ncbi:TetR-like C-terminal domain-containing protein [Micromonospora sp. NBC_01813]|uniref:TetR-like C-terminal domain-containing protein n=1 Tax=Micromonospora sp. NBC_01813 TaxID=2975988 RepID=UPI002DDA8596|nr:TetR-like C-terminal domain-containing protein [Micromonospora sp. NBC_01813]WSA11105.1 WHG domain-containing protein [Micromonospora sp. NBC_01813]